MNTHEAQMQAYREPYEPTETPEGHWSTSPEYTAYKVARERATMRLNAGDTVHRGQVAVNENDPAVKAAYAAFLTKFPAKDEPTTVTSMTPRQAELQAAQIELRRAVKRMQGLAHGDRIVRLVQEMVSE